MPTSPTPTPSEPRVIPGTDLLIRKLRRSRDQKTSRIADALESTRHSTNGLKVIGFLASEEAKQFFPLEQKNFTRRFILQAWNQHNATFMKSFTQTWNPDIANSAPLLWWSLTQIPQTKTSQPWLVQKITEPNINFYDLFLQPQFRQLVQAELTSPNCKSTISWMALKRNPQFAYQVLLYAEKMQLLDKITHKEEGFNSTCQSKFCKEFWKQIPDKAVDKYIKFAHSATGYFRAIMKTLFSACYHTNRPIPNGKLLDIVVPLYIQRHPPNWRFDGDRIIRKYNPRNLPRVNISRAAACCTRFFCQCFRGRREGSAAEQQRLTAAAVAYSS